MTDNELISIFKPLIMAGLTGTPYSLSGFYIWQNNQPTTQGLENTDSPVIYFQKIGSKPYGFLKREDVWDTDSNTMIHQEVQYYESTWQFSAMVKQDPAITDELTASDWITYAYQVLNSDACRVALNTNPEEEGGSVGILRVTGIKNPYFLNDKQQFTAFPSFDITFTYKNIVITGGNVVESVSSVIRGI